MKRIALMAFTVVSLMACSSSKNGKDDPTPARVANSAIVGKWSPTYITTSKGDNTNWHTIQTFVALPTIEFRADGKFLKDGQPGADCCGLTGNSYAVTATKITFSDKKTCPEVACLAIYCEGWQFEKATGDTLIFEDCFSRMKYVPLK